MRDKVFIAWSGNDVMALRVKRILQDEYNYICYIGGNSDNNSSSGPIGDTVIQQIKTCNQGIVIFQNKANGSISNNLFFELGYVFAKYGPKKTHCVRRKNESVVLPSDFDNAFVEPLDDKDDETFARAIVNYFLARQKMSIDINKMRIINNRYRVHDMIQSHYSENGSRCSDYELAQYILFYQQAAQMFGDEKDVYQEISDFKRTHHFEFSSELAISVNICLTFFELLLNVRHGQGDPYIDAHTYKVYADACDDFLENIIKDDAGTFDEWANVFVSQQLTYAILLFAGNPDNDDEMRELLYEKCIVACQKSLKHIEILEKSTPCVENNDEVGLVSLFKSYLFRNTYVSYKKLGNDEYNHWLKLSMKERKSLLRNFSQGSIDSKLYANFEMEYYLALAEYLLFSEAGEIDRFEQKMCLGEIKRYLAEVEKEDNGNFYVDQIGMYFNELKNA